MCKHEYKRSSFWTDKCRVCGRPKNDYKHDLPMTIQKESPRE